MPYLYYGVDRYDDGQDFCYCDVSRQDFLLVLQQTLYHFLYPGHLSQVTQVTITHGHGRAKCEHSKQWWTIKRHSPVTSGGLTSL